MNHGLVDPPAEHPHKPEPTHRCCCGASATSSPSPAHSLGGALDHRRGGARAQARSHAPRRDGGQQLAGSRLPECVCPARRDRGQRLLRLVSTPGARGAPTTVMPSARSSTRSARATRQGDHDHRVRVRRESGRSVEVRGPTRSRPTRCVPPRRVRHQAMAVGGDVLPASGLREQSQLRGRQSVRQPPLDQKGLVDHTETSSPRSPSSRDLQVDQADRSRPGPPRGELMAPGGRRGPGGASDQISWMFSAP